MLLLKVQVQTNISIEFDVSLTIPFNRYYRPSSPARTNIRNSRRLPQQYIPQEESDEIFYYTPAAYSNSSEDIVLEHLREYNLQRMKGSPSSHHQQVRTINVYIY